MICYLYYDTPEHPDAPAALACCGMSACRASSAVKEEGTWQEKPTFFSLGGHQSDHSSMIVKNGSVCLSHPRVFATGPGVVPAPIFCKIFFRNPEWDDEASE